MSFQLPDLPYAQDALAPHISAETLAIHHGKHHAGYVTKLNNYLEANPLSADKSLNELVAMGPGGHYNNAAQVWNHTFYWNSMSPSGGGEPTGAIADAINGSFGSFDNFKAAFSKASAGQFGSGWGWLVKSPSGELQVTSSSNAHCPMSDGLTPILTCDVWEHAYYVDYRNRRAAYIEAWWNLVNWDFANANL
jgi:Fe-Mn family superoxide dismutase